MIAPMISENSLLRVVIVAPVAAVGLAIAGLFLQFILSQYLFAPSGLSYSGPKRALSAERPDTVAGAEHSRLFDNYRAYHQAGNFPAAVAALRDCMRLEVGPRYGIGCRYGYALALLRGDGVERNATEAFRMFSQMGAAEQLADLYDQGVGVQRDPVMAAVYAWSLTHDPYFGLCSEGDCGYAHFSELSARLNAELSDQQRKRVNEIIRERFSERVRQYERYDALGTAIFVSMATIFALVCWIAVRWRPALSTAG